MTQHRPEARYNLFYKFLRLFADIRKGEAPKTFLLALNSFLLLMAYYILNPPRCPDPRRQRLACGKKLPEWSPGQTRLLSLAIEKYAFTNVFGVGIWIAICFLIKKEYRKLTARPEGPQEVAGGAAGGA
jgi:hypothetical protein